MTFRLLGMTEEDRLAFEQATGIKTEAARVIVEASLAETERLLQTTVREVQEVIGPHGSVTRLQAGGVQVTREGVNVYADGVLKTTIEADGDFLAGSDITEPSTTSFIVFVNDQTYNNEDMGEGDVLIGDNSSANVLYDASAGQLKFRGGSTINAYVGTDGKIYAGGGNVVIDAGGITFDSNGQYFSFKDTSGNTTKFILRSADDALSLNNTQTGKSIRLWVKQTDGTLRYVEFLEDGANANVAQFNLDPTGGAKISIGGAVVIWADKDGKATVFNDDSYDIDFRVEGATDANLLNLDAGNDRVGIGVSGPGSKLDVAGSFQCDSITNDTGLAAGTWNPSITNGTNVAASSASAWNYIRVGNQVFFNGLIQIDTTAIGAADLLITIPIASTFNSANDASGNMTQPGAGTPDVGSIREDQATGKLRMDIYAQSAANTFWRCAGGYIIK